MLTDRMTRSWTGALFRARRTQCALLLMTAMIGSAAVMTGCSGSGSVTIRGPLDTHLNWQYRMVNNPPANRGTVCGTMVHNGREYTLYCDELGRVIYAEDKISGKWYRITMQEEVPWLPSDVPLFEQNGVAYVFPPAPEGLALEVPSGVTAQELLLEWGLSDSAQREPQGAVRWSLDRSADSLDLVLCIDWSVGIPNPWMYEIGQELVVVSDESGGAKLLRLVGDRSDVIAYLGEMGLVLTDLEIDGFGPVPPAAAQLPPDLVPANWLAQ